ncbi:MAG TPA: hypothetical protein PL155_06230 [Candidatus Omnitrophota bacterium]|nr:hypothetical protein [Candidatus Omnitrophota bacterium]HPD83924.1 hypothetical protein [Candidatus Omnitrophota bacterium]HRZ02781.1 hypothetical protein [Candidatus Omnitrophota bacterium]
MVNIGFLLNLISRFINIDSFQISLYFLSALGQSMAALLAIGGIFAIYQFQRIENRIEHTCNAFKNYIRVADPDEPGKWLNKDVISHLLRRFKEKKDGDSNDLQDAFIDYFNELEALEDFRIKLRQELLSPTILITIVFGLALFALIEMPPNGYDIFTLFGIFLLGAVAVRRLISYIFMALGDPDSKIFNNPITSGDEELSELRKVYLRERGREMLKKYDILRAKLKINLKKLTTKIEKEENGS